MIPANLHELQRIVKLSKGPIPIGEKLSKKWMLFIDCPYLQKGTTVMQTIKAVTFSWDTNVSKVSNVFPGDEVKFTFSLSGRLNEEKLDYYGMPSCFNEVVIESKVEILNQSQRVLYNTGEKDDLGVFPETKFKYKDSDAQLEADTSDLPF